MTRASPIGSLAGWTILTMMGCWGCGCWAEITPEDREKGNHRDTEAQRRIQFKPTSNLLRASVVIRSECLCDLRPRLGREGELGQRTHADTGRSFRQVWLRLLRPR